ncbi:MAG: hypothetical protein ACXVZ2_13415, partial [Gaiellaceae bacterium]
NLSIFTVPRARSILTGPWPADVLKMTASRVLVDLSRPGRYRLAVRYSPYWHAEDACLARAADGMTTIEARRPGELQLSFRVSASSALAAVVGNGNQACDTN